MSISTMLRITDRLLLGHFGHLLCNMNNYAFEQKQIKCNDIHETENKYHYDVTHKTRFFFTHCNDCQLSNGYIFTEMC